MNRRSGPASLPLLGLVDATTRPPPARPIRRRVVVRGTDGTHMGVAVAWWGALTTGDTPTLDAIRSSCPASDALRSGLEVVLAQASWLSRMRACPAAASVVLDELAEDQIVTGEHRDLCRELAGQLAADPDEVDLTVTPISVSSLMDLVAFLGSTVEYRHKVAVADQLRAYRRSVALAETLA